ncbi:hypothetical protein T05_4837 [Trichinella murrelli]|uniref:Uncharacterized protein n=1 Tax=Trichinella murrelli TaxID=144512 RepID=A0A0V0T9F7_9BILA|nr:hypothetical protein T05_4837 [Trichinella murrelli]
MVLKLKCNFQAICHSISSLNVKPPNRQFYNACGISLCVLVYVGSLRYKLKFIIIYSHHSKAHLKPTTRKIAQANFCWKKNNNSCEEEGKKDWKD